MKCSKLTVKFILTIPEITSLYLPKYNLVTGQRTFKFRGIKLSENLTTCNNIKESLSIDSFKSKYKTKLTSDLYDCENFALDLPHFYQEYMTFLKCNFYLLTMCIYVNSLIDDPLKITFVDDMVTIKK